MFNLTNIELPLFYGSPFLGIYKPLPEIYALNRRHLVKLNILLKETFALHLQVLVKPPALTISYAQCRNIILTF